MLSRLSQPQQLTTMVLGLLGLCALVGAVVTANVSGSLPHDLVAVVGLIVGFLVGTQNGRATERAAEVRRRNGANGTSPGGSH